MSALAGKCRGWPDFMARYRNWRWARLAWIWHLLRVRGGTSGWIFLVRLSRSTTSINIFGLWVGSGCGREGSGIRGFGAVVERQRRRWARRPRWPRRGEVGQGGRVAKWAILLGFLGTLATLATLAKVFTTAGEGMSTSGEEPGKGLEWAEVAGRPLAALGCWPRGIRGQESGGWHAARGQSDATAGHVFNCQRPPGYWGAGPLRRAVHTSW